jgi:hypothetical protein
MLTFCAIRRLDLLGVGLALLSLLLFAGRLDAQSVVRGTVIEDGTRQPIGVVDLRLLDATGAIRARAFSDEAGRFRMEVPDAGTYSLAVSRVGYATVEARDVEIEAEGDLELEVRLAARAVVLDAVTVVADRRRQFGRLEEFMERAERNRRMGRGRVYLREDIARIRPISVQELINAYSWGTRCRPGILLNGIMIEPATAGPVMPGARLTDSLFGVRPEDIEGIELYRDFNQIPPEYYRPGMCGLALVWTSGEPGGPWSWKRVAAAGLLVAIIGIFIR